MKVEGSYKFGAELEKVWNSLLNADVLSGCLPGCETFERAGDESYDVVLRVGVAAISGRYTGKVTIAEKNYPTSYKMLVEGKGSGGTIRGEGVLSFAPDGDGTLVTLAGDAKVSGVVARVGQRLLGGVSKTLMDQFFGCMKAKVEQVEQPAP